MIFTVLLKIPDSSYTCIVSISAGPGPTHYNKWMLHYFSYCISYVFCYFVIVAARVCCTDVLIICRQQCWKGQTTISIMPTVTMVRQLAAPDKTVTPGYYNHILALIWQFVVGSNRNPSRHNHRWLLLHLL